MLAAAHGIDQRLPYNSDPTLRAQINAGEVDYVDTHLSHSAQHMWFGFYGHLDVAVVEVAAILPNGLLVPGSSVGNNKTWLDQADQVILEVNSWQPRELEGFHDIYYGTRLPPYRAPFQLTHPMQRIGDPYLRVRPRQGRRGRRDRRPRPQHAAQPAGRGLDGDGRPARGLPAPRGRARPDAAGPAAAAERRRQRRQRGDGRPRRQRVRAPDRVHRGHPGRHARPARQRQAASASATSFGALAGRASSASSPTSAPTRAGSCCAARRSPTTPSWSVASA